jgi:hypothetical protein
MVAQTETSLRAKVSGDSDCRLAEPRRSGKTSSSPETEF